MDCILYVLFKDLFSIISSDRKNSMALLAKRQSGHALVHQFSVLFLLFIVKYKHELLCGLLKACLLVFSHTGWHSSIESKMKVLASLSITGFIFHVLSWKLNADTILKNLSPHHLKDTHYTLFFKLYRQILLCQVLVTIISQKSDQHTELYLQKSWLKTIYMISWLEQHRHLIWGDSQPEFGTLVSVLLNIVLAGTSATNTS